MNKTRFSTLVTVSSFDIIIKLMWLGAIFSKKIGLSGLLIFYRKVSSYCTYSPLRSMLFNWRHLANLVSHTFSNRGLMIINLINDIFITRMWKLYCLIFVSSAPVFCRVLTVTFPWGLGLWSPLLQLPVALHRQAEPAAVLYHSHSAHLHSDRRH